MSNSLIFGVLLNDFYIKALNVIKAGFEISQIVAHIYKLFGRIIINPSGPVASQGGSVSVFLRKPIPGRVVQSVTCLATDACLTADPGVASSIPARYHTFVEIDDEIISTVILLPSADLFKKGCCQLQAKVCAQITG